MEHVGEIVNLVEQTLSLIGRLLSKVLEVLGDRTRIEVQIAQVQLAQERAGNTRDRRQRQSGQSRRDRRVAGYRVQLGQNLIQQRGVEVQRAGQTLQVVEQ